MKSIILIFTILACYLFFLPHHIQGGDSAELVAAGYFNLVAHPPGYPLWSLMLQLWTHLLSAHSIFWRASLLSSITAAGALMYLVRLRRLNVYSAFLVGLLAFSPAFFSAAVIPDVFALHALITAAFLFYYIKEDVSDLQAASVLPALILIGLCNHLTIIFLTPLLVEFIWRHRFDKKIKFTVLASSSMTFIVCLFLYLSLWLRNPESFFSWGEVHSLKALWNHFLRSDYGTFRLAPQQSTGFFNWGSLVYFLKTQWFVFLLSSIALIPHLKEILKTRKNQAIIASLIISIIFLTMSNFTINGMGEEIILRFHLMPTLIIFFWAQSLINEKTKYQIIAVGAFFIVAITTVINNFSLAHDSLIEQYCMDLLQSAQSHHARVIISNNDNSYFGLRFLQLSTKNFDEINVISPPLLFHSWYSKKWLNENNNIKILNENVITQKKVLNLNNDVINPNIATTSFLFTENFSEQQNYHLTYTKLGRIISKGSGTYFDESENNSKSFDHNLRNAFQSIQGFSKKTLWSHYAHFYLAKGKTQYQEGKQIEARKSWSEALRLVPYASPALINLCQSINFQDPLCSIQNIESIKDESQFIFDN